MQRRLSLSALVSSALRWLKAPADTPAAMIANALIPFLFALSMKVNIISFLTALSHERLQVRERQYDLERPTLSISCCRSTTSGRRGSP